MHQNDLKKCRETLDEIQGRIADGTEHVMQALQSDQAAMSSLPTHLADIAETVAADLAILESESAVLKQVQSALQSLHDGTYGMCSDCGTRIDQERLEALPYATQCIRCATMKESPKRQRNRERTNGWAAEKVLKSRGNGQRAPDQAMR